MTEEEKAIWHIYHLGKKLSKSKNPRIQRLAAATLLVPVTAFEGDQDLEELIALMLSFAKEKQNQIQGIKELLNFKNES